METCHHNNAAWTPIPDNSRHKLFILQQACRHQHPQCVCTELSNFRSSFLSLCLPVLPLSQPPNQLMMHLEMVLESIYTGKRFVSCSLNPSENDLLSDQTHTKHPHIIKKREWMRHAGADKDGKVGVKKIVCKSHKGEQPQEKRKQAENGDR